MSDVTASLSGGSGQTRNAIVAARAPRRWPGVLAAVVVVLAAYLTIGFVGVGEEAREERILGSLTPIFLWLRDSGNAAQVWMQGHRMIVGLVGSALLLAVAAAAFAARGRRAGPVGLLTLALGLAGWGQVALQGDTTTVGLWLYLGGVACAVGLGVWCPLRCLAAIPPFPPAGRRSGGASVPSAPTGAGAVSRPFRTALPFGWECALVAGLTLVALVSRTWALTELYDFFDLEMIDSMVQARTWSGYAGYLDFGFVQNNGGAVHLLPAEIIFRIFGTSIFTLRMTAVLWSISAVPLMYALGRRIGGVAAGVFASVLLITAPEQLFWARNENVFFSPSALCALVTAHLALWMVERFSLVAVLCNVLWMPWCRWFYSACMVAFLIPITSAVHAMAFVRGLWRKVWYVIPLLAVGLGFWIISLTVMRAALHDWHWQFVDPSAVYGASAWRKQGEFADASLPDLVRLQAVSLSANFAEVVRNMTYETDPAAGSFSHWCQHWQPTEHRTIINVGLTLLVFVGLGYLLGQIHDRRAFLLFAVWGIALLPGILSQEPADRRMAMMFPASQAIAGTVLAALLGVVAERGGRLAHSLAQITAAGGLAAIGLTNLSSHLLLPINPVLYGDYARISRPMFAGGDAIFTNVLGPFRTLSVFGNLDHFLAAPTCLQHVDPQHWLETALNAHCAFDDPVYQMTIGEAATDRLRKIYVPKRITYWLTEEPASAPYIALLQALHPDAPLQRDPIPRAERTLVKMSVDADSIAALRTPSFTAGADAPPILADVPLQRAGADAVDPPAGPTVGGGILIDTDGWYRWRLDPPCPAAALTLDGAAADTGTKQPLLAGVHPFTLAVPRAGGCALPLRIVMDSDVRPQGESLAANRFTSQAVASLPDARAPRVEVFDGYAPAVPALQFKNRTVDFGVDAQGNISVLLHEGPVYRIRRYDRTGTELAAWEVPTPLTINPAAITVSPEGNTAILVEQVIHLYDPHGTEIASWQHPWFVWETQLAFWGGKLIANIHHRDSIAVFTPEGQLVREFTTFEGGPGKLYAPMAFALGAEGDLLVQQLDGQALRFHLDGPAFDPVFVERFRVDATLPGSGFDGPERILVASERGLHAYGRGGVRLMAGDPARDPSQHAFGSALHVRRANGRLFVLDPDRNTLWTIPG